MYHATRSHVVSPSQVSNFVAGTYGWMALAIGVTAVVSFFLGGLPGYMAWAATGTGVVVTLLGYFATFGVAFYTAGRAANSGGDIGGAALTFLLFSAATGALLTPLIFSYTAATVAGAFAITASTFGLFSVLGFTTKIDLSRMGAILMMALFGLIVTMIVNMFLGIAGLAAVINYVAVLIFVGLTAWDAQQIRQLAQSGANGGMMMIMAMNIYLDFVNLFIHLLQIMGGND